MLETVVGLVVQRAYGFLLRDFAFELPLAMRFMLEPVTLLTGPVAFVVVIEGVWRKSSEAGQVVRCLVAVVAAVGLLIGLAATMNVLRSINPQKTENHSSGFSENQMGAFPDFRPQKLSGIDHLRRPEWRLHAAEGGYSVRARRPTSGVISCGA